MATSASVSATEVVTFAPMETLQLKLQVKQPGMTPHPPNHPKPKGKLRLDPERALEPARKKLSTLESQRIMAVLVDSIRKTELVTILPYIIDNLDRFKITLGSDLVKLLEEHRVILQSFDDLKNETDRLLRKEQDKQEERERRAKEKEYNDDEEEDEEELQEEESEQASEITSSGGSQVENAMRSLSLVAKQMQFSCKNIMRAFSLNPAAQTAVLKDHAGRLENAEEMIVEMNELKDIIMGMLLTTPVEESERTQYLQEISERERYNASIIDKLEKELKVANDDKDDEIRKKNDVIRRLQADLHQIEKFSEEHIRRTKSDAEKQEAADTKNSEGKRVKLQQELSQYKTQMQNLTQEHRENEQNLRRKKFKVETEVENWIQKYDQEMGERQDEYEEIDAVYTEEKKQLNELEERFKTLEAEYNQIQEERRVARERREAAERELQMSVKAATCIQAFWRSYKVRKALKSKKKKKGGGKKKK